MGIRSYQLSNTYRSSGKALTSYKQSVNSSTQCFVPLYVLEQLPQSRTSDLATRQWNYINVSLKGNHVHVLPHRLWIIASRVHLFHICSSEWSVFLTCLSRGSRAQPKNQLLVLRCLANMFLMDSGQRLMDGQRKWVSSNICISIVHIHLVQWESIKLMLSAGAQSDHRTVCYGQWGCWWYIVCTLYWLGTVSTGTTSHSKLQKPSGGSLYCPSKVNTSYATWICFTHALFYSYCVHYYKSGKEDGVTDCTRLAVKVLQTLSLFLSLKLTVYTWIVNRFSRLHLTHRQN